MKPKKDFGQCGFGEQRVPIFIVIALFLGRAYYIDANILKTFACIF